MRIPISLDLQENWIKIYEGNSYIRERMEGETLVLQLIYPQNDYKLEFFTEGPRLAQPSYIKLEKNATEFTTITIIKIKISFV